MLCSDLHWIIWFISKLTYKRMTLESSILTCWIKRICSYHFTREHTEKNKRGKGFAILWFASETLWWRNLGLQNSNCLKNTRRLKHVHELFSVNCFAILPPKCAPETTCSGPWRIGGRTSWLRCYVVSRLARHANEVTQLLDCLSQKNIEIAWHVTMVTSSNVWLLRWRHEKHGQVIYKKMSIT